MPCNSEKGVITYELLWLCGTLAPHIGRQLVFTVIKIQFVFIIGIVQLD